jgi:hypothetical protein
VPRWCRIRSYLHSATACGLTALDAITPPSRANPGHPRPLATVLLAA